MTRHRARIGRRLFFLFLFAAMALRAGSWLQDHPEDLPWTPLTLDAPIGRLTALKIDRLHGDFAACRAILDAGGESYARLAPVTAGPSCGYADGVRLRDGFAPATAVSCPLAAALVLWRRQVVDPAAMRLLGQEVDRIDTYGSYNCRRIAGRQTAGWSGHARSNAIDIASFRLADGRRIAVAADWHGAGAKAAFLHAVRDGGCRVFATTLSPDYNAAHRDHLHLDAARRGGWTFCR